MKRRRNFSLITKRKICFAGENDTLFGCNKSTEDTILLRTIKTHNLYTPFRTDTLLSRRLLLLFYAQGRRTIQRRKRKRKRTVSSAFGWLRCAPQIASSFFSFERQTHSSSISFLFLQTRSPRRRSNSWSSVMMSRRFASFSRSKTDVCACDVCVYKTKGCR